MDERTGRAAYGLSPLADFCLLGFRVENDWKPEAITQIATGSPEYKDAISARARGLAWLFRQKVGGGCFAAVIDLRPGRECVEVNGLGFRPAFADDIAFRAACYLRRTDSPDEEEEILQCPGGPGCTCCGRGCDCGCKESCPAYTRYLIGQEAYLEEFAREDRDYKALVVLQRELRRLKIARSAEVQEVAP